MKKVLIIEDEDDIRELIDQVLSLEGYNVAGAENGMIGIEKAKAILPDIILCDINMPNLNGFEVLDLLRKESSTATIPFIFLSARTDQKSTRNGMNLGADDYLYKPFSIDELKQSIKARLEKSALIAKQEEEKLDRYKKKISNSLEQITKAYLDKKYP